MGPSFSRKQVELLGQWRRARRTFFSFEESEKGAIAGGMLADFIVLSDDILSVPPDAIRDLRVERTFIGGREIKNSAP